MSVQAAQTALNTISSSLAQAGQVDPTIEVGADAGAAVSAVISAIGNISDNQKEADFTQAFDMMSQSEKVKLGNALLAANDQTAKMQILANAMVTQKLNNIDTTNRKKYSWILFSSIALSALIIIFGIAKRKRLNHE